MNLNRRQFIKFAISSGIAGLISSYPVLIERYIILLNTYRIPVPNLPEAFKGFQIAHLTDLHYGFLVPLEIFKTVIKRTNNLHSDLIVCTGDYVHERNNINQIDKIWPILSKLKAGNGVFSVLGNHDHWADTERSLYWAERAGQNIRGKVTFIENNGKRLWFAGGGDLLEDHFSLDKLLKNIPDDDCRIVLAHNPDSADTSYSSRVDLIISGHTHGGQVNIPFIGPPVLPVRNKNYSSGIKRSERNTLVFISKGIGWTILPVRFNCFPEIAVLELVPEKEKKIIHRQF